MARSVRMIGLTALAAIATAVLAALIIPGCTAVNDNQPISISQGRASLSVACSTDGAIAYLTDGRNVYRYDRATAGPSGLWECILSQTERQEMAVRHDSREPAPPEKPAAQK